MRIPVPTRICHRLGAWAAAAVLGAAPPAWSFGDVGFLTGCATFTTCTAELASGATWHVRETVSQATPGYFLPYGLVLGQADHSETEVVQGGGLALTRRLKTNSTIGPFFVNSAAEARSAFGTNRADVRPVQGAQGDHRQLDQSAHIRLQTFAQASSAWRDVLGFSGNGRFQANVAIDGAAQLIEAPTWPPFFDHQVLGPAGDWFYELRVWDATHQSVSDDFELGGPTAIARVRASNADEQRSQFSALLALDFDVQADTQYVITAELRVTGTNGRRLDLFHTIALQDVVLSDGLTMTALSGHDYQQPVPEPASAALLLAGLAAIAAVARRRRARG